jgi:CRP/FNR family cyclic AMP-dependent transcriptional regulator
MVPIETLKGLDIFDGLSEKELESLTEIAEIAELPKGSIIFREHEDANNLFVLLHGNVAIQFEVGHHRDAVVHSVGSGQAFGWSALVQPYQFTATARCINASTLVTISRVKLRDLMEEDCHMGFVIMEKLAELVSERLRETRIQLISMLHG